VVFADPAVQTEGEGRERRKKKMLAKRVVVLVVLEY